MYARYPRGDISLYGVIAEVNQQRMRVSVDEQPNVGERRQAQDVRIRRRKWMKYTRNSRISTQIIT